MCLSGTRKNFEQKICQNTQRGVLCGALRDDESRWSLRSGCAVCCVMFGRRNGKLRTMVSANDSNLDIEGHCRFYP